MLENDLDLGLIFNQKRLTSPNLIWDLTSSKCLLNLAPFFFFFLFSFFLLSKPRRRREGSLLLNVSQAFLGAFARP